MKAALALTLGLALGLTTGGAALAAGEAPPVGPGVTGAPDALRPVPVPELGGTEARVRQALELARTELEESLLEDAGNPAALAEAYGATGLLYHAHLILDPAEACYANAARLAPEEPRWPYYLGYLHQGSGRYREAAEAYARALAARPGLATARLRLGETYLELGQIDRAEPLLREALAAPGLEAAARFALGRLAYARQDYDRALEWLEAALAADPGATRAHYPLALAYRALGDLDRARGHLARRGDTAPAVPDPLIDALSALAVGQRLVFHAAMEAVYREDYAAAAAAFRDGLARDPGNLDARVSLARALYLDGDREGARGELLDVRGRAPGHGLARFLLAVLEDEGGAGELAERHYRATLDVEPAHPGAHYYLANRLMRRGDYPGAARHYRAALEAEPDNPYAQARLALALVQARAPHAEVRSALEAARTDGGGPEVDYLLAALLAASAEAELRDGPRAVVLAEAMYADAPSPEHARALAMAWAEAGDYARAIAMGEVAVGLALATGRPGLVGPFTAELVGYRRGQPSRSPWPEGTLSLEVPPVSARPAFRDYPADAPY